MITSCANTKRTVDKNAIKMYAKLVAFFQSSIAFFFFSAFKNLTNWGISTAVIELATIVTGISLEAFV